jgi:hypothetical protein
MLCGAHLCSVLQRIVPRAAAYLGCDRLQAAVTRSRYTVVPIDEEQPLSSVEHDDGWESIKYLGVPLHPRVVEVRLGLDRRVREEICDSQLRHLALIIAASSKIRNPDHISNAA